MSAHSDPLEDSDQGSASADWRGLKVLVKTVVDDVRELKDAVKSIATLEKDVAIIKERQTQASWLTPEKVIGWVFTIGNGIVTAWAVSKIIGGHGQ